MEKCTLTEISAVITPGIQNIAASSKYPDFIAFYQQMTERRFLKKQRGKYNS